MRSIGYGIKVVMADNSEAREAVGLAAKPEPLTHQRLAASAPVLRTQSHALSISVAMATFNGGRFIRQQLDSIANQTLLPVELVISDDGSTDDTLDVVKEFAVSAPFPVHISRRSRTVGYVQNFRSAISHCAGELIACCDQDDWWLPQRLERCASKFGDPDLLLLYHNATVVDEERRKIGRLYDVATERRALDLKPLGPWNHSYGLVQIFRAKLRDFDDLWDESLNHIVEPMVILSHDQWYFFLAQALGHVEFLDDDLVEYRQHRRNTIGAQRMRPSVERRMLARIAHNGSQDLRCARAAEARSRIIDRIAQREPSRAFALTTTANCYRTLAKRCFRRYETYSRSSFGARLASLIRSYKNNDYSEWPWGFDRRSVVRDLWSGVILARR